MPVNQTIPRKGARRTTESTPAVRPQSSRGKVESRMPVEGPGVDFAVLLRSVVPRIPCGATETLHRARMLDAGKRMALAGEILLKHLGAVAYLQFARHRSDTVRGWAAYLLAASPDFSLGERLQLIRPLANDHSARVRDWAWQALRPQIAANILVAIDLLEAWTVSGSPFLRRFAIEATRPCGEACVPVKKLLTQPDLGLPLLEPLRADSHRYVQESVGDWLGDAAQGNREWVEELCERWQRESPCEATGRICERGMG